MYLPKGKYCVYPRMAHSLAIVMPPPPPFWMTENEFRSHFSPFQINTQFFLFFSQNGCRRPFWMTENHFRSHFSPFQINTQLWFFFHKMAAGGHFGWPKITFECISRHFRSICNFFLFWILFSKWPPASHFGSPIWAILDDRKSLSIAFLAISDQYTIFFFKMAISGSDGTRTRNLMLAGRPMTLHSRNTYCLTYDNTRKHHCLFDQWHQQ